MSSSEKTGISFKNYYFPLLFLIASILIEGGTFISLGFGVFPQYFLFDIAVMLILFAFIFLASNKIAQMVLVIIFIGAQIVISYVNVTLYNIYGDLFSFDMIALGVEAFKSFDPSFLNYWFLAFLLVILGVTTTLMAISLKNKNSMKLNTKTAVILASIFVFVQAMGIGSYYTQIACLTDNNNSEYDMYFNNDKNLYNSLFIKSESLKKFGTFGFYAKNFSNLISDRNSTDNVYEKTRDYILSGTENDKNNYSGVLAGDNVVVIMCESLEWYAIDPILTPTLYELFYNGTTLTNYVSKSKTNYSEIDVILGSVPSNNSFSNGFWGSSSNLLNNTLPFTLPNKLSSNGYETTKFFHNNGGNFYGRNKTHKTYGFDEVITLDEMDFSEVGGINKNALFQKDSSMIESCINEIAPLDKSFFSFITTVITHGPYNYNSLLQENYDVLNNGAFEQYLTWLEINTNFVVPKEENNLNILKNYKAAFMDLEKAIKYLVNYLEDNNLINNTSLVLYSDHNAYFHDLSYTMRDLKKGTYYDTNLYRVPATIYSRKLGKNVIDDFTCPYNLTPTLFDLLGVNYNTNLYMAPSIFSENFNDTIFVSQIGGIMQDGMYSDNVNTVFLLKDGITDEDVYNFKQNALAFYVKQDWINNIYNTNIFKYYPELLNNI